MISFIGTKAFSGPNPYATQPVIVSELQINRDDEIDLETYAARMSNAFGDWWPGTTRQPEESEELFIGRYLVEWCLTTLNEIRGCLQAGGAKQVGDQVIIWLEYHNIEVSRQCLDLSAILLKKMGRKEIGLQETNKRMSHIWSECHKSHPDYQAGILIESAKLRRIPYFPIISNFQIWQFGWGSNSSLFAESISEEDSHIGNIVATNKTLGKEYFLAIGAPVGEHQLVNNEGELQSAMERVGWPCVVKPIDRGQAKGVTVNVRDFGGLQKAYATARTFSRAPIMIETYIEGDVHRLLIVRGKFLAAARREPAYVVGNGQASILELAHEFNRERTASMRPGSYLLPAPLDAEFDAALAKQGYDRNSAPAAGAKVRLREIPLQGTGAINTDVTDLVHPDIKFIAETLANTLSIRIAGFDFLTPDITRSYQEMGAFLEINLCPSLRGHLENGLDVRGIADKILGTTPARIPFILVITPEGDIDIDGSDLAANNGLGWRDKNSVGIGPVKLCINADNPSEATRSLLSNKSVERVVIVCSASELVTCGMPVDEVDLTLVNEGVLDAVWLDVVHQHSKKVSPLPEPENFSRAITQCWSQP